MAVEVLDWREKSTN